ncbi:sulfurtransferase TusA family protein [Vulcanisaeta thermophila]|uniref:sulfurtransferase TusA family protein n=1 Tax=Vulcanisaeta thermophila TaxID=867917 RepID=UPI000853BF32|nr:sulfurtransferase TusA family protein [Vulcanisaeta thermophila]
MRAGELSVDLRGVGCPYGSMVAIQYFRDAPTGLIITFILDDEDCFTTLKKLFPLLGQRVISAEGGNGIYRLKIMKVKSL